MNYFEHNLSCPSKGPWRRRDRVARRLEDGERQPEDGRVLAVPALPDRARLHPHGVHRPLEGRQDLVRRTARGSRPHPSKLSSNTLLLSEIGVKLKSPKENECISLMHEV